MGLIYCVSGGQYTLTRPPDVILPYAIVRNRGDGTLAAARAGRARAPADDAAAVSRGRRHGPSDPHAHARAPPRAGARGLVEPSEKSGVSGHRARSRGDHSLDPR